MAAHAVPCDADALRSTTISRLQLVTIERDDGRDITSTTAAYPGCVRSTENLVKGVIPFPPAASLHDPTPDPEQNAEFLQQWYSREGGRINSSIEGILAAVDRVLQRAG